MKIILTIASFFLASTVNAALPNSLFSDNMVLQQGVVVPVWGRGNDGERVTVRFHGQSVSATVANGKWMVRLQPLPYVTAPEDLVIESSTTTVIRNVLVGEVWLCSGQSNMERQLGPRPPQPLITNWEQERDSANYPLIREFYVPLKYSSSPVTDVGSTWRICSPSTVSDFSAVGYFFAKNLFAKMGVPVGILFSAFGGTPAEDWISPSALLTNPELAELVRNYGKAPGWRPEGQVMNGLYYGMIQPLIPYALKGVCWYQGESNNDRPLEYKTILSTLIDNWRSDFGQGNFPFLIVQIAPHYEMTPEIRESQRIVSQSVSNTALIVTTDCGDAKDIHPSFKQPVGKRLAIAALALAYGEAIEYSGPVFKALAVRRNRMKVIFAHADGLYAKGNTPKGFEVAGADQKFYPATATIRGDKVFVSSPDVSKPLAIRYGWQNVPDVNLYNKAGLPASPFRSGR
jgi:sialate O-acetylesterase